MNLNKIFIISLLVLCISTYQSQSGIIITLLMQILMLKGALFMTMPLSLGAYMLGQGTGFFSGGMMGSYMMLRAANRYHKREKSKWTGSGGSDGAALHVSTSHGGWSPPVVKKPVVHTTGGGWGWNPTKVHESAYKKGVFKGKAIAAALRGTKKGLTALTHVLRGVQSGLAASLSKHKPSSGHGWGWPSSGDHGHSSHHGYAPSISYSEPVHSSPVGYGWEGPSYPGYGSGPSHGTSVSYVSSHSNPVNYHHVAPAVIAYEHYPNNQYGHNRRNGNSETYQTIFTHPGSDESHVDLSKGYTGPGYQYTGLLTADGVSHTAQEKSSNDHIAYFANENSLSSNTKKNIPNPLIESYLETRLEEEAAQKTDEEKEEVLQLIMLLRKAYLKQLLNSLKTEEIHSSTETPSSSRESKSAEIEEAQSRIDLMRKLLGKKKESLKFSSDSISRMDNPAISPRNNNNKNDAQKSTEEREKEIVSVTTAPFVLPDPNEEPPSSPAFWEKVDSSLLKSAEDLFSIRVKREPEPRRRYQQQEHSSFHQNYYHGHHHTYPSYYEGEGEVETVTVPSTTSTTTPEPTTTPSDTAEPPKLSKEEAQKQIDAFADDLKKFFTLLSVLDQDQCLQKLVCDVHTEPDQDLSKFTQYEANIITTFKMMKALIPPSGEEDSSTKYRRAALIGETGKSKDLCQHAYSSCTFSSNQIISLGTQAPVDSTDWDAAESAAATDELVSALNKGNPSHFEDTFRTHIQNKGHSGVPLKRVRRNISIWG